jgi:hypothetical protein
VAEVRCACLSRRNRASSVERSSIGLTRSLRRTFPPVAFRTGLDGSFRRRCDIFWSLQGKGTIVTAHTTLTPCKSEEKEQSRKIAPTLSARTVDL